MSSLPRPLVGTDWLASHLGEPDLVVVDASWYLAAMQRDPKTEYQERHIPSALFWDLDLLSDQRTALPHMLPDPDTFAREVGRLGIGDQDRIVVYDGSGANLSAPRVWWMFRVHGHDDVAVLDGGMVKWLAERRPVESGSMTRPVQTFNARFRPELVRTAAEVEASLGRPDEQLLDARSAARFAGTEPEPRPGLRSGHIPGAKNLPYAELVAPDGTLLPRDELIRKFEAAGIDLDRPVVTSCGSGVSACALALGLEVAGSRRYAVYDGSWAEWGLETGNRPVA
jgi:thiosulfate/3-mercaptopyruvate sulfurtransferase